MIEEYYNYMQCIFDFIMEYELPGQEIIGPLSIALGSAGFCAYYRKELHKYITERRRRTEKNTNFKNAIDYNEKSQDDEPPTRVAGTAQKVLQVTSNNIHASEAENTVLHVTQVTRAVTSFATMNRRDLLQEIHHAATISSETEHAERCIKLLMDYPEAVNIQREPYGFTPFLTACWAGSLPLVRYMLDHGANMEMRTNDGDTPLYLAVRALLETEERPRFTLLQLLLETGGSVNDVNHSGYSPLHLAAANGSKRLVKWLVEKGASPFQRNSQGYRPIDLANLGGHVKVVPMLTVTVRNVSNYECKTDSDSSLKSSSSTSPFRHAPRRQMKRAISSQFVHPMMKIARLQSCSTQARFQSDTSKLTNQQLRDPRLNRKSESSSVSSRRSRSVTRRKLESKRKCNYASM